MSDPARDGYTCHGPMEPIDLMALTGVADTPGVAAWVCECGVWRHAYPPVESQLRAIVESRMAVWLQSRTESK